MAWGTLQISDTLNALLNASGRTVAAFGVAETYALLEKDLAYHNQLVNNELIPDFCYRTDQPDLVYGGTDDTTVEEIDEYGRPGVQKTGFATSLGQPLSSYGRSVGWTWDYMQVVDTAELAKQYVSLRNADLKGIKVNLARRIFNPLNNLTYRDFKINNKQYRLRAFINADSEQVMTGPEGQNFDGSTHTHFMAASTLSGPVMTSLVNNVLEHGRNGDLIVFINLAQEAAVRGFTGSNEFTPYVTSNIRQSLTAVYATGDTLNLDTPEDRAIGIFGAATVWVKPWVPAGYMVCVDKGTGDMKPLAWRTRPGGAFSDFGLRGKARTDAFPLYADTLARDYGIGVYQRHMVAVLYIGGASYVTPTISA